MAYCFGENNKRPDSCQTKHRQKKAIKMFHGDIFLLLQTQERSEEELRAITGTGAGYDEQLLGENTKRPGRRPAKLYNNLS